MLNNQKFCFIYCVSNEPQFADSWQHVCALNIPTGFSIENKVIRGAEGITAAYNWGMTNSDARYKVYLHQDVNILNRNFIADTLSLFYQYPNLGMLGVLGAKKLPANGVWWESNQRYGKILFFGNLAGGNCEVTGDYESVQALDGMIMITQYDIHWRDDILLGWHFYDVSQSLEFIKAGFTIGVPKQIEPWCAHNSITPFIPFQMNQYTFVQEYKAFLGD